MAIRNPMDVKGLFGQSLSRLAKQNEVKPTEVRVKMFYDKTIQALGYELNIRDSAVPVRRLSFLADIVDAKYDIFQREATLNGLLIDGLEGMTPVVQKFAKEFSIEDWTGINVFITTMNDETLNPILLLFNNDEFLRQIFIDKDIL